MISRELHRNMREFDKMLRAVRKDYDTLSPEEQERRMNELATADRTWLQYQEEERREASHFYYPSKPVKKEEPLVFPKFEDQQERIAF